MASSADTTVPTVLAPPQTVAALLSVSPGGVRKLVQREGLPVAIPGGGGKPAQYDLGAVGRWIELRTAARVAPAGVGAKNAKTLDLTQEKARLAREQRESAKLRNEKARGDVLEIAVFGHTWGHFVTSVRSRLEALPLHIKRAQPDLTSSALDRVGTEVAATLADLSRLRFDSNGDMTAVDDEVPA